MRRKLEYLKQGCHILIVSVPIKTTDVLAKKLRKTLQKSTIPWGSVELENYLANANTNQVEPPLNKTFDSLKAYPVLNLGHGESTNMLSPIDTPLDWVSVVFRFPKILSFPRGNAEPVVIVPGYFTDKRSLELLAQLLKYLNYSVYQLELSNSPSKIDSYLQRVSKEITTLYREAQQPISLIGCSFGSLLCSELQQNLSTLIGQVVMIGKTPHPSYPKDCHAEPSTSFIRTDKKQFGVIIDADMCMQITYALAQKNALLA